MAKIMDRFLLLLFSVAIFISLSYLLVSAFNFIPYTQSSGFLYDVYTDVDTAIIFISSSIVLLLISVRLFYIAVRSGKGNVPSIDQRTEFGDIRISMETVENLALKAAQRTRGVRDLKSRVKVSNAGLEIEVRTIVDGETSIPLITEEIQQSIKGHVEEITGIPVAFVSVFVANVVQASPSFKSRVE
jgi:uncharacterized alkaline shock family protein YloU